MNKIVPIEYKNQRIMTTKVLAEEFGASEKNINDNFSNNKDRFKEGKHYIKLDGQALKDFKNSLPDNIGEPLKFAPKLILWTDRGAARHAKILDTDEAWEVYEELEENYFNPNKVQALNTSELSPELQMFKQIFDTVAKQQLENKQIKAEIRETKAEVEEAKEEIQGIRDIVAINSTNWRKDTSTLISKIALKLGGYENINLLREESYKTLEERGRTRLSVKLTNKRRRMADEGVCKSKRDKLNKLDVIGDDSRLLEIYLAVVKDMAIKYGVKVNR